MLNSGFIIIALASFYFAFFAYRLLTLVLKIHLTLWIYPILYLLVLLISLPAANFLNIKAVIYYHILAVAIFLEIVYFFTKKYVFMRYIIPTGLACAIIVACIFGYGFYNMHHIVKTTYRLQSDKIDHLKIAVIADLHMGVSVDQQKLQAICDEINQDQPDLVVLAGDIFDENTTIQQMKDACAVLATIDHNLGIYYVYGNHDQNLYTSTAQYQASDIETEMEKNGITVLDDEIAEKGNITVIGRGDARFYNDGNRMAMTELYTEKTKDSYVIVIDHQPLELESNASLGCDLQISGHTHGGQLFPQGVIQSLTSDTLVYGKREIGEFTAITTSGISGWRYPIKTGAPSEYVIIEIN